MSTWEHGCDGFRVMRKKESSDAHSSTLLLKSVKTWQQIPPPEGLFTMSDSLIGYMLNF